MATESEPAEIGRLPNDRLLWRVSAWGISAAVALAGAAFITRTDIGAERLALAFASPPPPPRAVAEIASPDPVRNETKRLEEQVQALAADRDRLAARLASLEQNLDDVTGSIKRQISQVAAAAPAPLPAAPTPAVVTIVSPLAMPALSNPDTRWPGTLQVRDEPHNQTQDHAPREAAVEAAAPENLQEEQAALSVPASTVPMPPVRVAALPPASEPPAEPPRRLELAIDIGGAQTMDVLNARWAAVKANFGPMLVGLHPRAVHDHRAGAVPYRLLVGPLPNGAAAAKLCAQFAAARVTCRTARFAGTELTQRRAVTAPVERSPVITTPR